MSDSVIRSRGYDVAAHSARIRKQEFRDTFSSKEKLIEAAGKVIDAKKLQLLGVKSDLTDFLHVFEDLA